MFKLKSQHVSETVRNILSIWSDIKKELKILEFSKVVRVLEDLSSRLGHSLIVLVIMTFNGCLPNGDTP
jgi:hypothetical protein